jgi:hypothetical protein
MFLLITPHRPLLPYREFYVGPNAGMFTVTYGRLVYITAVGHSFPVGVPVQAACE